MFDLYVVTDSILSKGRSDLSIAEMAYRGGADCVQLRMKNSNVPDMLKTAIGVREVADDYGKFFIVNDNVKVAMDSGADGVHLGLEDMPVSEARDIMSEEAIIGASVTNVDEAVSAAEAGATYLGVGAIFSTATKPDAKQGLGLDVIYEIRNAVDLPLVAIGGINKGNIQDVILAGADCAAVVSAVVSQDDVEKATHDLRDLVLKAKYTLDRL